LTHRRGALEISPPPQVGVERVYDGVDMFLRQRLDAHDHRRRLERRAVVGVAGAEHGHDLRDDPSPRGGGGLLRRVRACIALALALEIGPRRCLAPGGCARMGARP